jgi:hypothetical protein
MMKIADAVVMPALNTDLRPAGEHSDTHQHPSAQQLGKYFWSLFFTAV